MTQRQFVMLDRDSTIIVQRDYLSDPRQVELLPGAGVASWCHYVPGSHGLWRDGGKTGLVPADYVVDALPDSARAIKHLPDSQRKLTTNAARRRIHQLST
jgi:hypothetical protein